MGELPLMKVHLRTTGTSPPTQNLKQTTKRRLEESFAADFHCAAREWSGPGRRRPKLRAE